MSLKDDCRCGHDRTHHFLDPKNGERCNCLAMRCDCRWFRADGQPEPPMPAWAKPKPPKPKAARMPYGYPGWSPDDDDLIDEDPPETPRLAKPHANTTCKCSACVAWLNKRWGGRVSP